MSKSVIFILLALSLGLNVGVIATTLIHRTDGPPQGPPPREGQRGEARPGLPPDPAQLVEGHLQRMAHHLELTQQQQRSIRAILEQFAAQQIELQMGAEESDQRLSEAFAAPAFDSEAFRKLTTEKSIAHSRLDSLSALMLVSEASVLTYEQRVKFAKVAPLIHSSTQPPQPMRDGPPPRR